MLLVSVKPPAWTAMTASLVHASGVVEIACEPARTVIPAPKYVPVALMVTVPPPLVPSV